MSGDGERVIISCNPHVSPPAPKFFPTDVQEIQLWAVEPQLRPVRNFRGHVHREFLIRSCFGAARDRFVLSGSEGESPGLMFAHPRRARLRLANQLASSCPGLSRTPRGCQQRRMEPRLLPAALCQLQ